MRLLFALLLLNALATGFSIQKERESTAQADKASTAKQNGQGEQHTPPSTAPIPGDREVSKPILQGNKGKGEQPKKEPHDWVDFLNAVSTFVVAIFTIVLAVMAINQSKATKTAERAWMVPDIDDMKPPESDELTQIKCSLLNKGRTPAWVTATGSCAELKRKEADLPKEPRYTLASQFPKEGTVIPPKAQIFQGFALTSNNLKAVEQGLVIFYVCGFVKYRDIFGGEHETRYCFEFHPAPTSSNSAERGFYLGGPYDYNKAS